MPQPKNQEFNKGFLKGYSEYPDVNEQEQQVPDKKLELELKTGQEKKQEQKDQGEGESNISDPKVLAQSQNVDTATEIKSEQIIQIEKIMSDGLEEMYLSLDPASQKIFKEEGEKSALMIDALIKSGKEVAKKILLIIRNWLSKIPGINEFFLEQESKIKTDKIIDSTKKDGQGL